MVPDNFLGVLFLQKRVRLSVQYMHTAHTGVSKSLQVINCLITYKSFIRLIHTAETSIKNIKLEATTKQMHYT